MRTEAEQTMINQIRVEAEMHRIQVAQQQQMQNQQIAQFVGAAMQKQEENNHM